MGAAEVGMETLDCGCKVGREGEDFVIKPCDLKCPMYLYAIRYAKESEAAIEYRYED